MQKRILTALPVYNEARNIGSVLEHVRLYAENILVVNDGSTDDTAQILAQLRDIQIITHPQNQGYGAALRSAFLYALREGYDVLVTIDCDGQHQPELIPHLAAELDREGCEFDIVSGSRYLKPMETETAPPEDRRRINQLITKELNERLGLRLTDAFCGFKAYRVSALRHLNITELGYAMPLQVWVQAVTLGLSICEYPVPLVYLDLNRSFGGSLDNSDLRLRHYRDVLESEIIAPVCRELPDTDDSAASQSSLQSADYCGSHQGWMGCDGFLD